MTQTPQTQSTDDGAALAAEWYAAYRREALAEDGDPEAFIANLRELVEPGLPASNSTHAFGIFLERLREEDLDSGPEFDLEGS